MSKLGLSLSLVLLLAGCQTLPRKPAAIQGWDARRAELQQKQQYAFNGRVAVALAQEGFNAQLRWQQQGARSQLALNGPFGAGGVAIAFEDGKLEVRDARGRELDSEAARQELVTRLGFEPPFENLRYWVLGVPDPVGRADVLLDTEQRLSKLLQNDWLVEYDEYSVAGGAWLPRRITLRHDGVRVRLLVENWQP